MTRLINRLKTDSKKLFAGFQGHKISELYHDAKEAHIFAGQIRKVLAMKPEPYKSGTYVMETDGRNKILKEIQTILGDSK